MINFEKVFKRYPGNMDALQDITLEILPAELVFVTGPSGAGKSTLLKLISSVEKPTSGTIVFENKNLSQLKTKDIPYLRRHFGMIFQDHKLLYDRNCFENVSLPLAINDIDGIDINRRVRAALDKVGLLNKEKMQTIFAILDGQIVDKHNRSVLSYGDIIKTGTLKKLSEVFKIKKDLTILKVKNI